MIDVLNENEIVNFVRNMTDDDLHVSTLQTAEKARKITLVLLRHLNEIDRRRLLSKRSESWKFILD